jgi:hypothetical protein
MTSPFTEYPPVGTTVIPPIESLVAPGLLGPNNRKKRGRPKGSKNKKPRKSEASIRYECRKCGKGKDIFVPVVSAYCDPCGRKMWRV